MFDALYELLGYVLSFFYDLIPNYGVAIILLTIFVRVVLLPLTIKQTKSMQAMQKIQPQMKELQVKHKGDKQRLNEEMMKLYKTHQVNPLGGCLPLVLQFPVFIALFRVLNTCGVRVAKGKPCPPSAIGTRYLPASSAILTAIQTGNTVFLGMSMAASPADAVSQSGPVAAIPYFLLLAMMGLTTWYQTKQAAGAQPPGAANTQMAIIGKVMPAMLMLFSYRFPAGVSIYWVVSNLWTIGQQRALLGPMRTQPGTQPPPQRGAGGPKGDSGPKSPKGAARGPRSDAPPRAEGAKTERSKGVPAAPGGRGSKGAASQKPGGAANGRSVKSGNPKAQGGQKPAPGAGGASGGGNRRDAAKGDGGPAAKGDGGPAPKGTSTRRPSGGGGQARKKRGRR